MNMRLGSLTNVILENANQQIVPEVGMGGTVVMWTDRHAVTIVSVSENKKEVEVVDDIAKRTDNNGYYTEDQRYEFTPNEDPRAKKVTYTLRKNGKWIEKGVGLNKYGTVLVIGKRDAYNDPTF